MTSIVLRVLLLVTGAKVTATHKISDCPLVQHDLSVQFDTLTKAGDPAIGLALLDELDAHFAKTSN